MTQDRMRVVLLIYQLGLVWVQAAEKLGTAIRPPMEECG